MLVVSWFLMAIVLATIYTVYKSGLKVRAGRGRCVGVVSCNVTAHDGVGCAQGEVAQVLYHQHQRLAAAWQLFGCHVSGKLSWSVWEQLFAVLKPHYRPEKVRTFTAHTSEPRPHPGRGSPAITKWPAGRHGVPYPGQGPKGLPRYAPSPLL